MMVAKLGVT
jgi:hypothetical protein